MPDKIYVLIDHGAGKIRNSSWESLTLGQKIAQEAGFSLSVLLLGQGVKSLAEQVARKKADAVLVVEDQKLAAYDPDTRCEALRQILEADKPYLLLMGHIYQNIDLAPKLAAALKTGLVTDCIGYRRDGEELIFIRQMFRNKINADIRIESGHPWIVTMQSGAYGADNLQEGSAPVTARSVDLSKVEPRRKVLEAIEAIKGKVDLSKAEIIIAVGRGIKKQENLSLIEELAKVLGAEIGASRPVVDNEWLGRDRQIGSSEIGRAHV